MALFVKTPGEFFVANTATLAGELNIGPLSSFWFGSSVRGDIAPITIGRRVNLQDNAVIHVDYDIPNVIEDDVTVGHGAVLHGMLVGAGSLIGMGAILLSETKIGRECLIAAGATVPPGLVVPDRMMVMGVPGRIVRPVRDEELAYMRKLPARYAEIAQRYANGEFEPVR